VCVRVCHHTHTLCAVSSFQRAHKVIERPLDSEKLVEVVARRENKTSHLAVLLSRSLNVGAFAFDFIASLAGKPMGMKKDFRA